MQKQQRVPHDSADRELSKLAPGGKAGGPVKPAGNPLLMRKAPPPRVNVKSTTTEQTWKDETGASSILSGTAIVLTSVPYQLMSRAEPAVRATLPTASSNCVL